jgi:hypothetical protein
VNAAPSENSGTDTLRTIQELVRSDLSLSADRFRRALVAHFGLRPYTLDQAATVFCLLLLEQQGFVRRIGRDGAGNILWGATRRLRRYHHASPPRASKL